MALGVCSVPGSAGRGILAAIVLVHGYLSWPSRVPKYGKDDAWRLRGIPWREALRIRSEDAYLERWALHYDAVRMIHFEGMQYRKDIGRKGLERKSR
jgi:hypothetical protein